MKKIFSIALLSFTLSLTSSYANASALGTKNERGFVSACVYGLPALVEQVKARPDKYLKQLKSDSIGCGNVLVKLEKRIEKEKKELPKLKTKITQIEANIKKAKPNSLRQQREVTKLAKANYELMDRTEELVEAQAGAAYLRAFLTAVVQEMNK